MNTLKEGDFAPKFQTPSSTGDTITLSGFTNQKRVVLYFYPKDDTPGCTKEACGFRDSFGEFARLNAVVLGVSPDSVNSHGKFVKKFNLPFPLLSDPDKTIAQAYGVWGEKKFMGRTYMGVLRTTFIIGQDGKIEKIYRNVKPEGHDEEVLNYLKLNKQLKEDK